MTIELQNFSSKNSASYTSTYMKPQIEIFMMARVNGVVCISRIKPQETRQETLYCQIRNVNNLKQFLLTLVKQINK